MFNSAFNDNVILACGMIACGDCVLGPEDLCGYSSLCNGKEGH